MKSYLCAPCSKHTTAWGKTLNCNSRLSPSQSYSYRKASWDPPWWPGGLEYKKLPSATVSMSKARQQRCRIAWLDLIELAAQKAHERQAPSNPMIAPANASFAPWFQNQRKTLAALLPMRCEFLFHACAGSPNKRSLRKCRSKSAEVRLRQKQSAARCEISAQRPWPILTSAMVFTLLTAGLYPLTKHCLQHECVRACGCRPDRARPRKAIASGPAKVKNKSQDGPVEMALCHACQRPLPQSHIDLQGHCQPQSSSHRIFPAKKRLTMA